ncbi:MAG: glycosyltransferase family 8 protein [Clostridia bacterium]|nr:glycosyltransferase family 8 protein [Clostridia bacterium]
MNNIKAKKRECIPVFFAVDDCYAPFLCVALRSLIDNSSRRYDYHINILIDTLSDENKALLKGMQTENVFVDFVEVAEKLKSIYSRLHMRDYYTKATYYRFFVPEMFSQYDRGVYLDCDIVLTADVANLYHSPLGKNLVAAVNDEIIADIEVFAQYSEQVLKIPRTEYFNAGILVMNLAEMRRVQIEKQFADMLSQRTYRVAQDQDYLNKLCYGKVYQLPLKWNKTPMPDSDRNRIPKIAHYKINFKPWKYDNVPYGELFWEYAAKTPIYECLLNAKEAYTEDEKLRDSKQYAGLVQLALTEIEQESNHELELDALVCVEV